MKKILACLLVALMLVMALASCNVGGGEGTTAGGTTAEPTNAINTAGAKEFLKATLRDKALVTPADYTLQTSIIFQKNVYSISWTVEVTQGQATDVVIEAIEGNDAEVLVNVNEETETAVKYVLTATVSFEGYESATLVMEERTIPVVDLMTWQQYIDAEAGETVCVQGVITALSSTTLGGSKKNIWFQDENGGYYAFGLSEDPIADLGLAVGMTVKIKGTKDLYNGTHEIKDVVSVEIIDSNITNVTPADYTQIFANASSLKAEALVGKQSFLVTISGVTVLPQDSEASGSGYYKFKMGDLETYVRISGSECPISLADQATFKSGHAEHAGWTANVTGLIAQFNGNFYLMPVSVDAFVYTDEPQCEHATADWSKDGKSHWHVCTLCELPIDNANHTIVNNVCSACGYAPQVVTLPQAAEIGMAQGHNNYTADTYIIVGTVKEVYGPDYGNMYIIDEDGNELTIYGSYSADGSVKFKDMATKPQAGDSIVLLGVLGQYNSVAQSKNAWILSFETPAGACQHTPSADWTYNASKHWHVCALCGENKTDEEYHNYANGSSCEVCGITATPATVEEAIQIAGSQGTNKYSEGVYKVTGVIKSIASTQYGNMYIQDAEGNELYIYGFYSANGKVRYDAMETKPQVGDTVTVIGILGDYTNNSGVSTLQLKNASMVAHSVPAACQHEAGAEWFNDDNDHWNKCALCGEIMNKAAHDFANGDCVCGKEAPACQHASDVWASDDDNHWKVCDACGETFATAAHDFANGDCVCGKEVPAVEEMTVAEVLAANVGDQVTFTGVVTGIYQAYNSQYDNISVYISDETGMILAFRVTGNWAIDDILTITGTIAEFNGTKQIGQGGTAVKLGVHECVYSQVDVTNPNCNDGGFTTHTCPICKDKFTDSEVPALGHTTDNGTCERCGNIIGSGAPTIETVTYDFIGKQSGWGTSYTAHTINLDGGAKADFTRANEQQAGNAIDDRPVIAVKSNSTPVHLTYTAANGKTIDSITFNLKRWNTSKTFKSITLEYYDATSNAWVKCATLTLASNGALVNDAEAFSVSNLPAGVTQVRLAVIGTSGSSNTQVGITSIVVDVK